VRGGLKQRGWAVFAPERATLAWAAAALAAARVVLADPAERRWYRHGGTWFVGVDALPNDAVGRVAGGPPLSGAAVAASGWAGPWHRAQLSAVFPGYPRRDADETEAAHRFRLHRDAAHVDGLIAKGTARRRFVCEPHAFVLGIALTGGDAGAGPLVVWEASHGPMRAAFRAALAGVSPGRRSAVDVTEGYDAARREVFARCRRVELPLAPGQAVLLDRHLLHGVAPWTEGARAAPEGRIVAYFRPQLAADLEDWLSET
jgi:hypothetical protein